MYWHCCVNVPTSILGHNITREKPRDCSPGSTPHVCLLDIMSHDQISSII